MTASIPAPNLFDRILVLTPTGRDTLLACSILEASGFSASKCNSMVEVCQNITDGAAAAIFTEEAFAPEDLAALTETLLQQPAWSDFPVLIFTGGGEPYRKESLSEAQLNKLGNVSLLERPIRVQTFLSSVRSILRARQRQYQVRDLLAQRDTALHRIVILAEIANYLLRTERPEEIVQNIYHRIQPQLGLDFCCNHLFDPETTSLQLKASFGIPKNALPRLNRIPFTLRARLNGAPVQNSFAEADAAAAVERVAQVVRSLPIPSFTCHALNTNGKLIGTLAFGRSRRSDFKPEETAMIEMICDQVTVAIERKRTEELLHSLNHELEARVTHRTAELQESNLQMEAFMYSISHDLRAPLRAMHSFSQLLLEEAGAGLSPQCRDYLCRIIHSAGHMDALIKDLLAYSRLSRSELVFCDISLEELVENACQQLRGEIRQKHASISIEKPLPGVRGHSSTLQQVVVNLLSNALKFSKSGAPPSIQFRATENGEFVRLWVEDDGIGIAPEHHQRIFKVFERLHGSDEYEGTGIGLAIVMKAAARMGGNSGVESELGNGSRFWIELPRANSLQIYSPSNGA